MDRGTIVNLSQFKKIIDYFKYNWCLFLLTVVFLIGITLGVFIDSNNSFLNSLLNNFSDSFVRLHLSGIFKEIFLNSILINLSFYLLCFIFGTSVTGVTLLPLFIGIRGMLLGKLIADVYALYSLKGIIFNLLIIIPPAIISIVFLVASARLGMIFSIRVISVFLPVTLQNNLNLQFNNYWRKQLLFLLPIIFSCVFDAWISGKVITILNL